MNKEKGLVIVYTGEGKGKTTATLGLAIRAAGYDKRILIIQFGKSIFSGELESLKKFKDKIKLIQGGIGFMGILGDKKSTVQHQTAAKNTFDKLSEEIMSGKWDLIIADEIIGSVFARLLDERQVLDLIRQKPENLDLVLTGRGASESLISTADLVTEMKEIKHPFKRGFKAKEGIDF